MSSDRVVRRRDPRPEDFAVVVDEATSRRMAGIRQRHTLPELLVRQALSALGLRYRLANRDLPGSPDLANRSRRWALFVHGCFWHAHMDCRLATMPKRNRPFWEAKFAANRRRDRAKERALRRLGFRVFVVWQCELKTMDVFEARLRRMLLDRSRA